MAEEPTQNPETPLPVTDVPQPEEVKVEATQVAVEEEKKEDLKIAPQSSFNEETNVVGELPESQRKALEELKILVQESLQKHEFASTPFPTKEEEKKAEKTEEKEPEKTEKTPLPDLKIEETPKAEENEPEKTEETPVTVVETEQTPKTEETPLPILEAGETPKTEETPVTIVETEETETNSSVEAIKETIIEEVAVTPAAEEPAPTTPPAPEEVSIWGIPLLADERSDVILLKFLRARDFRVKDAFTMIRNAVRWRSEFGVDTLIEEEFGSIYEKVVFSHGSDKEKRPVVYNAFGEFQNKELYQNTFSDAEKRKKFLKWLIQFIEKTIRTLDFSPKGINTLVLVNDFKNSPGFGFGKRDLYKVIDKFLQILQDNYPEFVAKQVCVNVSWWYLAYNWIYLTVFTPRTKSKFVFASPSKSPETLFKYIAPEQVPVKFGGHSKEGGDENEFSNADPIIEVTIKPASKHPIEFSLSEGTELVWELRVIGWEVNYGAEFLPTKEGGYTLNIAKPKKVTPTDEPIISDTFKVTEAGKVVITIDNQSTKKKKLFYRSKVKA